MAEDEENILDYASSYRQSDLRQKLHFLLESAPGRKRMTLSELYAQWYWRLRRDNAILRDQVQLLVRLLRDKGILSEEEALLFLPIQGEPPESLPVNEEQLAQWLENVQDEAEGTETAATDVLMEIARLSRGALKNSPTFELGFDLMRCAEAIRPCSAARR